MSAHQQLMQRDLLARGWSKSTIRKVLGAPDQIVKRYGGGEIHLYDLARVAAAQQSDATWRKHAPKEADPTVIDLMDALQEITRAAKRARDGASASYSANAHGFARLNSERKRELYELKDQCVAHLIQEGRLQHVEYHRFGDRWASLRSPPDRPTIRLHVPCPDPHQPGLVVQDLGDQIPSRRRGKLRLSDAIHTCEQYLEGRPTIETYSWPAAPRPVPIQECYDCGGAFAGGECLDGCGRNAGGW